jgi:hypothetical protein
MMHEAENEKARAQSESTHLRALIDLDNIINEPFKPEEVKKKCSN